MWGKCFDAQNRIALQREAQLHSTLKKKGTYSRYGVGTRNADYEYEQRFWKAMSRVGDGLQIKRIPKEDLFGIFYVKIPAVTLWSAYYNTIDALRPLLADREFNRVVSGFYINYNYVQRLTRISYFVNEANLQEAVSRFQNYFRKNAISEVKSEPPREEIVAKEYGGKELEERFRYFLNLETRIGLELMKVDLLQARILFATYCLRVRKGQLPVRDHFEPTFMKNSPIYASLPMEEREQFLDDLERLSWAHMFVNFVLGCDFTLPPNGLALSIPEINKILRAHNMRFQVPLDWKP